jgi:8-oxo-dGTP pyrophosphatase MutT (NUDIX family)
MITCGIYLYDQNTDKMLVCHATKASWKSWSIPKGMRDDGEDSLQAASRELFEETGIKFKDLDIVFQSPLPPVKYRKQKKILESFLVVSNTSFFNFSCSCHTLTKAGHPEIDAWRWIPPENLPKYVHESQLENLELVLSHISKCRK